MSLNDLINEHFYADSATHERTRVAWVIGVTLLCVVASLLITYTALAVTNSPMLPVIFVIAALAPGIIAPITTWIIIGAIIKVTRLEELHRHQATYDDLSGLLTRRAFLERCEALLRLSVRNNQPFTLTTLDLDKFKRINDEFGHGAGDEVIKTFSQIALNVLRNADLAGRLGGEEFAIALLGSNPADARQVMERLRRDVEASSIEYFGKQISVTVSIGIASTEGRVNPTLEGLLRHSDAALYQAKDQGRNRIELAGYT
ncbi:GGDEF domain protein [Pseudohongiella spirulinae]|uniref:diguanylate cyclase n=2 Tax=Pseudohongiella spirulinae TaxID=1249552 RepID=A0A0S2KDL7_9GAMM|nr:GGDEF domain protein [Pseudohongiella spirulinae]